MKILVVEDEEAIANLIMINLKRVGYDSDYACNGRIGANMIENSFYDLILLDIMMPEIDDYELMEYIEPQGIPAIFITAKGSVKDKIKGLHMGLIIILLNHFQLMN